MYFDAHCDTLTKAYESKLSLFDEKLHINIPKLLENGNPTQVFAIFNEGNYDICDIIKISHFLRDNISRSDRIDMAFSKKDIDFNKNQDKASAMLSVEGLGNTKDVSPDMIDTLYDLGVRMISLTWNQDNCLCGGIESNACGITQLGYDVIERMKEKNIVLDLSHISDRGFYDAMEIDGIKVVASHSNSRLLCPHNRNLTDDMFKNLIRKNGVCGINFYPLFLTHTNKANVDDVVNHILHFLDLGGENNIGIGSDFDGIEYTMDDIFSCNKMLTLVNALVSKNVHKDIIYNILYGNFERVFEIF